MLTYCSEIHFHLLKNTCIPSQVPTYKALWCIRNFMDDLPHRWSALGSGQSSAAADQIRWPRDAPDCCSCPAARAADASRVDQRSRLQERERGKEMCHIKYHLNTWHTYTHTHKLWVLNCDVQQCCDSNRNFELRLRQRLRLATQFNLMEAVG